ncbi:hypothetical protein PG911_13975 [Tenacibaculum ovolyticum]|uniref:hypothetical protein n=1 Tax=Tenacibaculum ovolyticum TaxID=104270 RepID=UPI0022F3F401|nr:hypothetical protein [Tenacibaculum ovolyticum]WBX75753.1 hypothetical protein PG911_13975 [Tenacibaculum ovolyticum]
MKNLLLILLLFTTFGVFAQNGKIFFETNFNTFSHSSLSSFQEELKNDILGTPIKVTDDFPSNIGFTLGYEITNSNTAIFASYNATGGKISYSDFSGVLRVEEALSAITIGGIYYFVLKSVPNFKFGLRGFTMFSNLNLDSYSQIGDTINQEEVKFNAIDFGAGIQFNYEYPLLFLKIRANLGYDLTFGGKLKFKENSDLNLVNDANEDVTTGWSGLRIGLGVAIPIK